MSTSWLVIPCAADKADAPAPARHLYASDNFRLFLTAAETDAARRRNRGEPAGVLILSAKHGLVDPDTVLAPYDLRMGQPGAVTPADLAAQITDRGIGPGDTFVTLLPKGRGAPYLPTLAEAARLAGGIEVVDLFAHAPGIGYQRGVAARLRDGR